MAKTVVWYGELRTKRGNTIVIKDDDLPQPATEGRVYLYNTEREEMVEYVETIVADKLFELDAEQQKAVEKQFGSGWESARKQLSKANGKPANDSEEAETAQKAPASKLAATENEPDDTSDDFDEE